MWTIYAIITFSLFFGLVYAGVKLSSKMKEVEKLEEEKRNATQEKDALLQREAPADKENLKIFLQKRELEVSEDEDGILQYQQGTIYLIDTDRLPVFRLRTGYNIPEGHDISMAVEAMKYVKESIIMVDGVVYEENRIAEFYINTIEEKMGHIEDSIERYEDILSQAAGTFLHKYNELHDESRRKIVEQRNSPKVREQKLTEELIEARTREAVRRTKEGRPQDKSIMS